MCTQRYYLLSNSFIRIFHEINLLTQNRNQRVARAITPSIAPGTEFGRLTVIRVARPRKGRRGTWVVCKCSCGGRAKSYPLISMTRRPWAEKKNGRIHQPRRSCGCLAHESFEIKLQAKISTLPTAKIEAFIATARKRGVVFARRFHRLDRYVASRLWRLAKSAPPLESVPAVRVAVSGEYDSFYEQIEYAMKLAIRRASDTSHWFRRAGELTRDELSKNCKGHINWAWHVLGEEPRVTVSLPPRLRPLRNRFLEICLFTFQERRERRRAYLRRKGWTPKEKPRFNMADMWEMDGVLLPGMIVPKRPRVRRRAARKRRKKNLRWF